MRANLRGVLIGSICGVFAAMIFIVGGCGSSSAGLPFRQVDRAGKPGVETIFMKDPKVINTFNFLSPAGDKFALDTSASGSVQTEYQRVLTAFSALACFAFQTSGGNIRPFLQDCPASITLGAGAAPAAFVNWVVQNVVPAFEGVFLPDVIRLDTAKDFIDRDVLRYAFGGGQEPLICRAAAPKTYCGGRRFGEDDLRFDYSQMFLGTTGALAPSLATVQDDGTTTGATIAATFPYLEVPH